jgi:ABC-2 type transport system ATP-binding protein
MNSNRDPKEHPLIHARGLARTFKTKSGPVDAVLPIDFDVEPGEIVGMLGPNGAGKTTTLRMLTTLLTPTAGTAQVVGVDLVKRPRDVRRKIGYVSQIGSAPAPGTRIAEELITQGRLQGLSKAVATERVRDLLPRLDLGDLGGRALSELSGGQRRRFDVAIGLVHSPQLVFLDEPTTGLDPQSRANLWEHIRSLRDERGVTILITTHYLDEADALCDRIMVMDHGKIVANDTPDALKAAVSGDIISVTVDGDLAEAERVARAAVEVRTCAIDNDVLRITVERGDTAVAPLLRALDAANLPMRSVNVARPTLDTVFLELTGRSLREDPA